MNTIGKKIKEIRKTKGFSQEELSDLAKVNLRTIQRIENNESEPRGKTLSLICEVLHVDVEHLMDFKKQEDKSYLIGLHLSVLTCLVFPLGNLIFPLILWISKKKSNRWIERNGYKSSKFSTYLDCLHFCYIKHLCPL
ncbi:MAG: helix-turn-helix domain-containing protein [Flavobacteriales bacterium]